MQLFWKKADGSGKAALVAGFYFTCSISMNFLNKAVVSSYEFNYPFFIMSCQMVVTVVVLDIFRILKLIKLPAYSLKDGVEATFTSKFNYVERGFRHPGTSGNPDSIKGRALD